MENDTAPTSSAATADHGLISSISARVAGLAMRRAKTTIVLWILLVAACIVAGGMAGTKNIGSDSGFGESARADRITKAAGLTDPSVENVLVRSGSRATTLAAAARLEAGIRPLRAAVTSVSGPAADPALLTDGGRTALVRATLSGDAIDSNSSDSDAAEAIADVVAAQHQPGVTLVQAGPGSLDRAGNSVVGDGLRQAELISVPVTLLILLLAFGSLVAALVPLGFGLTTVAAALGGLGLVSHVAPQGGATSSVVLLVGLAVSVDYSLFFLRRERSERRAGASADAALRASSATVGRAILISALTVLVSLAGLFLSNSPEFVSIACGTMIVVAIAGIGSVTVLPAVLSLLGDGVERGRLPFRHGPRSSARRGLGHRLGHAVTGRPKTALATAAVLLGSLTLFAFSMQSSNSGSGLPASNPTVRAQAQIELAFPGAPSAAELVVTGHDLGAPALRRRLLALAHTATATTGGSGSSALRISKSGDVATLQVPMPDRGQSGNRRLLASLRTDVREHAGAVQPGAHVLVTGQVAGDADWAAHIDQRLPYVVAFVLGFAFLLLIAAFRSPLLALSMMALSGLSVGAAYGVLVLVFQHTWADGILAFSSSGAVVAWLPLFAFTILFGLSMDYTVLILERIREGRRAGLSAREAAADGIAATSGAVTSAAAIMIAVFSIFATLPLLEFKQLGVGMAAAILLDATIVRTLALPAVVALLGERGWKVQTVPFARARGRRGRQGWDTPARTQDASMD